MEALIRMRASLDKAWRFVAHNYFNNKSTTFFNNVPAPRLYPQPKIVSFPHIKSDYHVDIKSLDSRIQKA